MGYDFTLLRISPKPSDFPFQPSCEDGLKVEPLRSPAAIEALMEQSPHFRRNGDLAELRAHVARNPLGMSPESLHQCYRWEPPNRGHIDIQVIGGAVGLDMHADWDCVLDLLRLLEPLEPGLVILDPQDGNLYDAQAFAARIANKRG